MFIADYIKGILTFPLDDFLPKKWLHSKVYLLKGIDGLNYVSSGSLLAIQNNSTPKKLVQINYKDDQVTSVELIDNGLKVRGEPTNGFFEK